MAPAVVPHRGIGPAGEVAVGGPAAVLDLRQALHLQRGEGVGLTPGLVQGYGAAVRGGELGPEVVGLVAGGVAVGAGQALPGPPGGLGAGVAPLGLDAVAVMVMDHQGQAVVAPVQEGARIAGGGEPGDGQGLTVPVGDVPAGAGGPDLQIDRGCDTLGRQEPGGQGPGQVEPGLRRVQQDPDPGDRRRPVQVRFGQPGEAQPAALGGLRVSAQHGIAPGIGRVRGQGEDRLAPGHSAPGAWPGPVGPGPAGPSRRSAGGGPGHRGGRTPSATGGRRAGLGPPRPPGPGPPGARAPPPQAPAAPRARGRGGRG